MQDTKKVIEDKYYSAKRMFQAYTRGFEEYYDVTDAITASIYLGRMNTCVELMITLFEDYCLSDDYKMIDRRVHKSEFKTGV